MYFDITLRTWSEMKVTKTAGSGGATGTNKKPRTDMKEKNKTYTVKAGDSLSKIAKLELGDSSKWNQIYKLNQKMIGKDPNAIKPGQKLVLL